VLLIGGTSGTGKSSLAARVRLARRAEVYALDDLRALLRQTTPSPDVPGIRFFDQGDAVLRHDPEELLARTIARAREVCAALNSVVTQRLRARTPLIVEGDDLLPEFVDSLPHPESVSIVFVLPTSEAEVACREVERGPELARSGGRQRSVRVRTTWLYAEWLRAEATKRRQTVLNAAPIDALVRQYRNMPT
jgi:2-phosphoglycerate kinase